MLSSLGDLAPMGKSKRVRHVPPPHLRAWRESLGLSRQAVANKLATLGREDPIDQGTIAKWESGETAVRVEDWLLLANVYGVTGDRLFFPPGDARTPELMRRAFEVITQKSPEAVDQWIGTGEGLKDPPS